MQTMVPAKDYYLIIKLTNECNMQCPYCYHVAHNKGIAYTKNRMEKQTLELIIKKLLDYNNRSAHFTWHGGEPLLMGMELFEFIVDCQKQNNKKGLPIFNRVQTNGVLLSQEYIKFFKENDFHIGISLDGPPDLHIKNRNSNPEQFARTIGAIKSAEESKARVGVLTVVGPHNVLKAKEIYEFFAQNQVQNISFLPCVTANGNVLDKEATVAPKAYGEFLCDFFDSWKDGENAKMRVKNFDEVFRYKLGIRPVGCINNNLCNEFLTITPEGGVFLCDNFAPSEGSFVGYADEDFAMFAKRKNMKMLTKHMNHLPEECEECDLLGFCNSGCKYYRYVLDAKMRKKQYFCLATRMLYSHINKVLEAGDYDLLLQH